MANDIGGRAEAVLQALTSVSPEPVQVTVDKASLIVLQRDGHLHRWETLADAPFKGDT